MGEGVTGAGRGAERERRLLALVEEARALGVSCSGFEGRVSAQLTALRDVVAGAQGEPSTQEISEVAQEGR